MNISTPDLCDAHEKDVSVLEPLFANYGGIEAFGGEIVTVKCFEDNSLVKEQLAQPGQGRVLVVDGGGSLRRALLGDMIAESAVRQGWSGVVIYGAVRDVDALAALELGVQALGAIPLKTEKRGIGDLNVPLRFAGVDITPGQYLYADNNGIIISAKPLI
jgi:regulator of ribonuclease activity A